MLRGRPTKDFKSRTMLHRRESNNSFTAHAPRPDLVALSQSRILFANSMSDFTRANIEEVVDTRRPVGTEDVQRKRKRNAGMLILLLLV